MWREVKNMKKKLSQAQVNMATVNWMQEAHIARLEMCSQARLNMLRVEMRGIKGTERLAAAPASWLSKRRVTQTVPANDQPGYVHTYQWRRVSSSGCFQPQEADEWVWMESGFKGDSLVPATPAAMKMVLLHVEGYLNNSLIWK
jgi:hypothetical protein